MKTLYVLQSKKLQPPKLHFAVDYKSYHDICDSCELQAYCTELFGERGKDCEIHKHGYRWQEVKQSTIEELRELL